jgi:hypothetical protein
MTTTIIINTYHSGVFYSTSVAGTFKNHDDAEKFLKAQVFFGGEYTQIAPCGYERLDTNGDRFQHVIVTGANERSLDINGRWING